jgi:DNA topoisomerase-1
MPVTLRTGRFGPYVQLGEGTKEDKPKRSSIPKGVDANDVTLEYALQLLSLPRLVGDHPETGKPITASLGRYGPFILHDGTYANLPTVDEVFSVGINRAVVLLAEKKAGGGKGRFQRAAPTVLKELGEHPSEGGKVQVLSGRYGPYVKHGAVNATLPRSKEPANLTMEEAVELIAERVAKGPSKPKGRRGKPAKTEKPDKAESPAKASKPKGKAKKTAGTKEAAE